MANSSGIPGRSPPRGPRTPVSDPTLLIVTQDHQVNICYFRHYIPSLKIISCSLTQPGVTLEGQTHLGEDRGTHGKRCLRAAIGLSPNGNILLSYSEYFLTRIYRNIHPNRNMVIFLSSTVRDRFPTRD